MTRDVRHVMVVVNDLQPYGAQRVAVQLAASLAHQVERVTLVTVEAPERDGLVVPETVRHVQVVRRGRGAWGYGSLVMQLRSVLRREHPDLVTSHMVFSNVSVLAASRTMRTPPPIVVTEHGLPEGLSVERSERALRHLVHCLYPSAHRIVGVSQAVSEAVRKGFKLPIEGITTIYNPIDVETLRRSAATSKAPHEWLCGARQDRAVVCVAGFRPAKGQDVLIDAIPFLPRLRVIFVGDGDGRIEIERRATRNGVRDRVHFVGYRDDASIFIKHARCLVIPSRWEGFGLVAVEAAALGVPVVATEVGGLSELVPRFVPGLLVEPECPKAIAAAVENLEDVVGHHAVGSNLDEFSPESVARRYLHAFERGA